MNMTGVEILHDWLRDLEIGLCHEIEDLTIEQLSWQPDPDANSIGVTVWHIGRWLDLLKVRVLDNLPPEMEQWHTRGWTAKTGYDPRGVGYRGYGTLTGYSQDEVAAIPILTAEEHLSYLRGVIGVLSARLMRMTDEELHLPAQGLSGRHTAYVWLKTLLTGCIGHLGEIAALKSMQSRSEYYSHAQGLLRLPEEVSAG